MGLKINMHKRESVSTADKPWLGKRVKGKDGREIWNKDPAYSNDLTRPVWMYFKYDHPEHLISSGWNSSGTLVISEITNPKYKGYKNFGQMWYDTDADLLRMEFDNGKKFEFPTDAELETLTSCILDNKPKAKTESNCSMQKKIESLGKKNEAVDNPSIMLYNKVKDALPRIEALVKEQVGDKELDDGYWLHTDVDGVLDNRISSVTDANHYDLSNYEFDEGEEPVVRCLVYYLTTDPGIYDDEGDFVGDNNMASSSYTISIEIDPAGEDFCVDMSVDVSKFTNRISKVGFSCFDAGDVDYFVEKVADVILCRLNGDNCYLN